MSPPPAQIKSDEKVSNTETDILKMQSSKHDPKKPATPNLPVEKVVVHPLVLLSVVDHFYRVTKSESVDRVIGILLGSQRENKIMDVSNSFAVPFDETDSKTWFLDRDYMENMYTMFKKVNAREKIVGWYHTGPKLNPKDIEINEMIKQYAPDSVLLIVDVQLKTDTDLPTEAYIEIEEVYDDGTPSARTFEHVASEMGAEEAEEVGVEHLLRDIKDKTAGTLSQKVTDKYAAVRGMQENLAHIERYLKQVADGQLPINHSLNYLLQDILNLIPDTLSPQFIRSSNAQLNDQMLMIYLGSLGRSINSLHNLINNKVALRQAEKAESEKHKEAINSAVSLKKDEAPQDDKKKSDAASGQNNETPKKG